MATPPKKPAPRRKSATASKPAAARKLNVAAAPAESKTSTPKSAPARPKAATGPRASVPNAVAGARDAVATTLGKAQQAIADASPARKWTAAAVLGGIGAAVTATLLTLRGSTPGGARGKKAPRPAKKAD